MSNERYEELKSIAIEVRKDVVRMIGVARSYGLASALTVTDILVYLYWEFMDVARTGIVARQDRLVLGKGAATPTLYSCLARLGYFSRDELWSFRRLGAMLQGYPDVRTPGVDAPGGIYGGGIGIAAGMATAMVLNGSPARVFCIVGDGELQEGSAWESIASSAGRKLGNLTMVLDVNSDSQTQDISSSATRLESLGWTVTHADGHDFKSLANTFGELDSSHPHPKAILARTLTNGGSAFDVETSEDRAVPMTNADIDRVLTVLESGAGGTEGP